MTSRKENKKQNHKFYKRQKKQPKQVSIFTILFLLLLIASVIGIYFGIRALVITFKYKNYTDKMYSYGYNELYENNKATAFQKVTNGEMLSVILGALTNTKEVSDIYYLSDEKVSDKVNWYNYSTYLGVNNIISKKQLEEDASKINSTIIIIKMLEGFLNVEIEKADLKMSQAILSGYSKEQQDIIAKAVTLGLIKDKTSEIKNKKIIKGELNKLIINMVEKYATVHHTNSSEVNIVTNKSEMPENYKEYPYIIDSIKKDIYELDYEVKTKSNFQSPKEVYKHMGDLYEQINYEITEHFSTLLNIDYSTITVEGFLEKINKYSTYLLDETDVQEYVEYVKNNNIKLKGNITPLLPIIYNNGENYQVRAKISFEVINSNTEYNLLFGDQGNSVKYNSKEITMIVDVPMGMTFNSRSLLVESVCMAQHMAIEASVVIVEE